MCFHKWRKIINWLCYSYFPLLMGICHRWICGYANVGCLTFAIIICTESIFIVHRLLLVNAYVTFGLIHFSDHPMLIWMTMLTTLTHVFVHVNSLIQLYTGLLVYLCISCFRLHVSFGGNNLFFWKYIRDFLYFMDISLVFNQL